MTHYTGPINHPVPTTGCGRAVSIPFVVGSSVNVTIAASPATARGSHTRTYRVYLPGSYDSKQQLPVVLVFHGYGDSAAGIEQTTGFSQLAEQEHFIAVYPQGLLDGDGGPTFWASVGPIDYGIDEALFVSNILNDLQQKLCVDAQRIYATGFSNGGGMTNFLACRLAGRIAAFAPVSGNFYNLPGGCQPGRPVSLLDVHGTADQVLPYNGISASEDPSWPLPSISDWLQQWAARDGCIVTPSVFMQSSALLAEQWTPCDGNAVLIHYRIENGGHDWPAMLGSTPIDTVLWQFFQSHPLS